MKKSLLLITMLLLSAAWVVAQSTSSTQSSGQTGATGSQSSTMGSQSGSYGSQTSSTSGMNHESIKGCLSGSSGNYTLTDSATGKTYNLTGSASDLSAHVGQEIEVKGAPEKASAGATGSASNPSGSSASSGTSAAGSSAAAAENFNVSSVKKISDTCSNK